MKITIIQITLCFVYVGTVYIIFKETESSGRNCLMSTYLSVLGN